MKQTRSHRMPITQHKIYGVSSNLTGNLDQRCTNGQVGLTLSKLLPIQENTMLFFQNNLFFLKKKKRRKRKTKTYTSKPTNCSPTQLCYQPQFIEKTSSKRNITRAVESIDCSNSNNNLRPRRGRNQ